MSPILQTFGNASARGYGFSLGAAVADGSFESIATVTVGAGGSSSVTFSSIPGTYTHLQIRGIHRADNGGGTSVNGYIQFNSDTGSNYSWHVLAGDSSAASAGALTSTSTPYAIRAEGTGGIANSFGASITDILDYANTNKYKTVRTITGSQNNGANGTYGAGFINLNSVLWMSTSAITSISLYVSGGPATWQQYSSFALYGIKGS